MILDPMDNILAKNTEHGNYNYGYDDLYRLTDVDNPTLSDEGYTYDNVGNRLTSSGVSGDWTYNENNELTAYGSTDFVYDANGNMTRKTVSGVSTNYIYNTEDRLAEVRDSNNDLIAKYNYDPFGIRLWKDVGGNRTYFMYADEGIVAEINSTGSITKSYVWQPDGIWGTDCVAVKENGQYYFVHNDFLGTPQKLINVNGTTVWAATYNSFGEASADPASTVRCNLRFGGQYYDQETKLHYNGYRYYDSSLGRYLRVDPIRYMGGENFYTYVQNSPLAYIDPLGLFEIYGYQNRGGGRGWETQYEIHFEPLEDKIVKEIPKRRIKPIKWFNKIWDIINTKPVGPNHPYRDYYELGKLDAELQKEYKKRFGERRRLTPGEAQDFLEDMFNKYPTMCDLYPTPENMLNEVEENSKNHWYYRLRGPDKKDYFYK